MCCVVVSYSVVKVVVVRCGMVCCVVVSYSVVKVVVVRCGMVWCVVLGEVRFSLINDSVMRCSKV